MGVSFLTAAQRTVSAGIVASSSSLFSPFSPPRRLVHYITVFFCRHRATPQRLPRKLHLKMWGHEESADRPSIVASCNDALRSNNNLEALLRPRPTQAAIQISAIIVSVTGITCIFGALTRNDSIVLQGRITRCLYYCVLLR